MEPQLPTSKEIGDMLAAAVTAGIKPTAAAKMFGVSHMTVRRACKARGIVYDFRKNEDGMNDKELNVLASQVFVNLYKFLREEDYLKDNIHFATQSLLINKIENVFRPHLAKMTVSADVVTTIALQESVALLEKENDLLKNEVDTLKDRTEKEGARIASLEGQLTILQTKNPIPPFYMKKGIADIFVQFEDKLNRGELLELAVALTDYLKENNENSVTEQSDDNKSVGTAEPDKH